MSLVKKIKRTKYNYVHYNYIWEYITYNWCCLLHSTKGGKGGIEVTEVENYVWSDCGDYWWWLILNMTYMAGQAVFSLFNTKKKPSKVTETYPVFSKHRPSEPMLSISRFVHMCVHVSVCLFTFKVPFKRLFSPTSQSQMSKKTLDSESLGKSIGKKWSRI